MNGRMQTALAIGLVGTAIGVAACGGGGGVSRLGGRGGAARRSHRGVNRRTWTRPNSRPRSTTRTGRCSVGNRWVYQETDTRGTRERVVVNVTDETKQIANGVEARVVRDTVTEKGVPVEITDDWYAQDAAGNIWYLGESVTELREREARRSRRLVRGRG